MKMSNAIREIHKLKDRAVRKTDINLTVHDHWTVVDDEIWQQVRKLLKTTADYWLRRDDHTQHIY